MNDLHEIINMAEVERKEKKKGREEIYPFSKLEVGQGFRLQEGKNIQSMRVLASTRGKTLGRKFSVSVTGFVERIA